MNKFSISATIQFIVLTALLSLFFACGSSSTSSGSLRDFQNKEGDSKTSDAAEAYWAIPEQYKNVPIEQIKSQIEITDYMVMKGAATNAGTEDMNADFYSEVDITGKSKGAGGAAVAKESPKNKADRDALNSYANKLISLEGVVALTGTQKSSPKDIQERTPGRYEIWLCADKNQQRKPCRYRAFLLYEAPPGKGEEIFTKENVIKVWGVMQGQHIGRLVLPNGYTWKRYPKIRVLDLEVIK
tara:strand:- start:1593 stop:2318 length:726 start_codon:yes stop_codon:yes gene_type:complete